MQQPDRRSRILLGVGCQVWNTGDDILHRCVKGSHNTLDGIEKWLAVRANDGHDVIDVLCFDCLSVTHWCPSIAIQVI